MNHYLRGCGKDDGPLTLYRIAEDLAPTPVRSNYRHIRCGYRPPSKIQNEILLCDHCIAKLGLSAFSSSRSTLP